MSGKRPLKRPSSARTTGNTARGAPPRDVNFPAESRVRAALAVSLDGYIADRRGGVEWLDPYFSPEIDSAGFMASIGATIMGRKTFDVAMKVGMPPGSTDQRSIVMTGRPIRKLPLGIERFEGQPTELVAELRQNLAGTGRDIWLMGGGELIDAFRAAELVDRFELSVIPVLLGDGIPLFPRQRRGLAGLKLVQSRALANGVVEVWYE